MQFCCKNNKKYELTTEPAAGLKLRNFTMWVTWVAYNVNASSFIAMSPAGGVTEFSLFDYNVLFSRPCHKNFLQVLKFSFLHKDQ